MNRQKIASVLLVLAMLGITSLSACSTSQRRQSSSPTPTTRASGEYSGEMTGDVDKTGRPWPTRRTGTEVSWSNMAYPTGNPKTSAVGIEKGVPKEVWAGLPFEVGVVVTNLTDNELNSIVLTESLDESWQIVGSSPQARVHERTNLIWEMESLPPRASRQVTFTAKAPGKGSVSSCTSVVYASLLCSAVPVVQPSLRLTKSGPSEVLLCDPITYTFELSHTGSGTVYNARVSDPLPDGMTTADGKRRIERNLGTLEPGQSRQFTATVKASKTGRYSNRATAAGDGDITATSGEVVTMVRQPVLAVSKTCPGRRYINQPIPYEITVTNTGDVAATGVVLEDTMPSGAQFVSASDGGNAAGGKVMWNLGTLAPRASKKVSLRCNAASAGTYRNSATARARCANAVTDGCETVVTGIPAILLEVIDLEDPIPVGENETYVITVTNQGSAPDTNIKLICVMENQTFVSASGPTGETARGNTVTFTPIASLGPKQKATYRLVVKTTKPGDIRFKVTMTTDQLGTRPVEETEATNIYDDR